MSTDQTHYPTQVPSHQMASPYTGQNIDYASQYRFTHPTMYNTQPVHRFSTNTQEQYVYPSQGSHLIQSRLNAPHRNYPMQRLPNEGGQPNVQYRQISSFPVYANDSTAIGSVPMVYSQANQNPMLNEIVAGNTIEYTQQYSTYFPTMSNQTQTYNMYSQPAHTAAQTPRQKNVLTIRDPESKAVIDISENKTSHAAEKVDTELQKDKKAHNNDQVSSPERTSQVRDEFRKLVAETVTDKSVDSKNPVMNKSNKPELKPVTTAASSSNSAPSNSPSNDSWVIVSPSSTDLVESKNVVNESPDSQPKQVEKSEETNLNSQTESNSNINVPIIESEKQTLSEIADEKQVDQSEQLSNINDSDATNVELMPSENTPMKNADNAQVTSPFSPSSSVEICEEPIGKTSSVSKRASYTIEELLKKRTNPISQSRPIGLKNIDGVTIPGTSQPYFNRASVTLEKPAFQNRAENPYAPADKHRLDEDEKFLREIKSILNKLTPQTYDKLLTKLNALELNNDYRLEGMISIIFIKAVEEPTFCSLYAGLCQTFQRKQVTVPEADGQMKTFIFRQILLTRCQKVFESDYRQEINYETRRTAVEQIVDEKQRREALENLDEDLGKAKRKKLGNIFFIGELFKLQMLTDSIMYECIEMLLADKTDEESLECLCKLLRTIGKEMDGKVSPANRKTLEKHYDELNKIIAEQKVSARIRFMIQDLMEERKAGWKARRAEVKPVKIDDIHEAERVRREQQEMAQEKDRHRREQNRVNNPSPYGESRGSRGSGMKTNNRNEEGRESHYTVNALRALQTNDKKNSGTAPMSFAPQGAWNRGSNSAKKPEDERTYQNRNSASKPPMASGQSSKSKVPTSPPPSVQPNRQISREFTREVSQEQASNNASKINGPNSPETSDSLRSSREFDSSVEKTKSNSSSTNKNDNSIVEQFDGDKTKSRVASLVKELGENYSDTSNRPVNEAIEDLTDFITTNVDHQALIVQELFVNVFEAKPRARKAVAHLLVSAVGKQILSEAGICDGFRSAVSLVPDFEVDIPLIWRYISEIVGAFVGASSYTISLFKQLISIVPSDKAAQFITDCLQTAVQYSSEAQLTDLWQSSNLSIADLLGSNGNDSSLLTKFEWLNKKSRVQPSTDSELVSMFKSINETGSEPVPNEDISRYIKEKMNNEEKYYIRNIALSFLEACLLVKGDGIIIQEKILRQRAKVLEEIINEDVEKEVQVIYAVQNIVHQLEHPQKIDALFFDLLYDVDCLSEDSLYKWRDHPDPTENDGHSIVVLSTKEFFVWLESDDEAGEDDSNKD